MTDSVAIDKIDIVDATIDAGQVEAEIQDIIVKLQAKHIEELSGLKPADYSLSGGSHNEGIITAILVAFAGALAKEAAVAIWNKYIWPSLELRLPDKIKRSPQ